MEQRIALVTGGGTGIGRASALALAGVGFDVVLAGRRPQPLEDVAAEIGALGRRAIAVVADISIEEQVLKLFERVCSHFERLDVLFNNAGLSVPPCSVEDIALADWNAALSVNLTGAFLCTREAMRQFKTQTPRGGRIINNGSLSAHVPRMNSAAYTASKHAISGLTKATALDGRAFDIACGQIDIGNAVTAMNPGASGGIDNAEPMIDVKLVADAVAHMARLPLGANILTLTVMATGMPYVGRG